MKNAKNTLATLLELDEHLNERGGSQAKVLLYIASKHPEPVLLKDIEEQLELTQGQISRITRELHVINSDGAPGMNMLDIKFDLYNPRTKLLSLNKHGEAILKKILS